MTCETCQLDRAACTCFYILSLKWTRGDSFLTWWCPANSGYTSRIDQAGRYAASEVEQKRGYYNNHDTSLAIPCVAVDAQAVRVVPDHALRKLVEPLVLKPIVESYPHCDECGNAAPARVLGLKVEKN